MLALSSLRRWCGIMPSVRAALLARRALHGDQLVGDLQPVLVAGALDQVLAVDHQRRRAADLAAHRELLGAAGLGVDRDAGHGAGELLRVDAELAVEGGDVLDRVAAALALERSLDVARLVPRLGGPVDQAHRPDGVERPRTLVPGA